VNKKLNDVKIVFSGGRQRDSAPADRRMTCARCHACDRARRAVWPPGEHDLHVVELLVHDLQGVEQGGQVTTAVPCWSSWKTGMSSSA